MKKRIIAFGLLIGMSFSLTGCFAGWGNRKATKGGYITDDKGIYVIEKFSGGQIMDVYIVKDTFVDEIKNSDGFTFIDTDGKGVTVQGDAEAFRINDESELKDYVVYHRSKDLIPYEEYYKAHAK
jgi:hypothetical protein